jgi:hypothetical protein
LGEKVALFGRIEGGAKCCARLRQVARRRADEHRMHLNAVEVAAIVSLFDPHSASTITGRAAPRALLARNYFCTVRKIGSKSAEKILRGRRFPRGARCATGAWMRSTLPDFQQNRTVLLNYG